MSIERKFKRRQFKNKEGKICQCHCNVLKCCLLFENLWQLSFLIFNLTTIFFCKKSTFLFSYNNFALNQRVLFKFIYCCRWVHLECDKPTNHELDSQLKEEYICMYCKHLGAEIDSLHPENELEMSELPTGKSVCICACVCFTFLKSNILISNQHITSLIMKEVFVSNLF